MAEDLESLINNHLIPPGYFVPLERLKWHYNAPISEIREALRRAESACLITMRRGNEIQVRGQPEKPAPSTSPPMTAELLREVICGRLALGKYGLGATLPKERDLAREFGVRQQFVHHALRPLKDAGILHAVSGQGTYVTAMPTALEQAAPASRRSNEIEQVLRQRLLDQTYDRLTWIPSVRRLADEFQAAPETVQSALEPLKREKLLGVVSRQGTYVVDPEDATLRPEPKRRYTARDIEQIIRNLLSNDDDYRPGTQLPTMAELANSYNVSVGTVMKALKPMKAEGLLTVDGGWTYITLRDPQEEPTRP